MPLFELAVAVSDEEIDRIIQLHWNLKVGTIIRTSQNHTFDATDNSGVKFAVRVVPDPLNKQFERMVNEVHFVNFIEQRLKAGHVCAPLASVTGQYLVRDGVLTVMVIRWAEGTPCSFQSYRWMDDEIFVNAWGRWIGEFHKVSLEKIYIRA